LILKNDLKRKNTNIIEINNKMQFHASELNKTNQILMELPLFRNLMDEKEELEEHVNMLKHNIMYFESTNRKLLKKVEKLKSEIKTMKKNKKSKNDYIKQEKITEDEDDDDVVFINQKDATVVQPVVQPAIQMVIEEGDDHPGLITCSTVQIKANEEYDHKLLAEIDDELSVGQELGEHESKENAIEVDGEEEEEEEVEVVEGEEEVEVVEGEEEEVEVVEGEEEGEVDEGEEKVEVDEGEEEEGEEKVEVVEGEEEEEVEVVEGEEEEEEVEGEEEVEVVEGEEEEVEVVEEEGDGEGDEDVYEIEINGNTYYVSNEKDSVIYAADENGEITIEAGVYKNGKPVFH